MIYKLQEAYMLHDHKEKDDNEYFFHNTRLKKSACPGKRKHTVTLIMEYNFRQAEYIQWVLLII